MDNQNNNYVVPQDPDYLTFGKMWKFIKQSFVVCLITTIITLVIVAPLLVVKYQASKETIYQTLLNYNYEGIYQNEAPNGTGFNKNEVLSPAIVEKAIANIGLDVDARKLSQHIFVNEVFSEETLKLASSLETRAKSDPKALAELQKLNHYTNTYQVIFIDKNNEFGLSDEQTKALLSNISSEYIKAFNNKYSAPITLDKLAVVDTNAEYMDSYFTMSNALQYNVDLLYKLSLEFPTYQNTAKQSFKDMAKSLELAQKTYLESAYSFIFNNDVYNNRDLYKAYIARQLAEKTAEQNATNKTVDSFAKDIKELQTAISKANGVLIYNEDTKNLHNLIKQKQLLDLNLQNLSVEIGTLTALNTKLQAPAEHTSELETNKTIACEKLNTANTEIAKKITAINADLDSFYETGYSQNLVSAKELPARIDHNVSKKSTVLYIAVSAIGGYIIGMIVFAIIRKIKTKKVTK